MGGKGGGGWSWGGLGETLSDIAINSTGVGAVGKKYYDDQQGHKKDLKEDAARQQADMERQIADRQKKEETNSIDAALRARRRVASRSARANYNRGTVLTSPIGVIGEPQTANKTLLGS
jgi:hypothetical protein